MGAHERDERWAREAGRRWRQQSGRRWRRGPVAPGSKQWHEQSVAAGHGERSPTRSAAMAGGGGGGEVLRWMAQVAGGRALSGKSQRADEEIRDGVIPDRDEAVWIGGVVDLIPLPDRIWPEWRTTPARSLRGGRSLPRRGEVAARVAGRWEE